MMLKGKTLENIVLGTGLLVIIAAIFLMFFADGQVRARAINITFATGFIIYIIYSYILAQNLNGEIYDLKKHVGNLKEEVARLTQTVSERDQTIAHQKNELHQKAKKLANAEAELMEKNAAIESTAAHVKMLEDEISRLTQQTRETT